MTRMRFSSTDSEREVRRHRRRNRIWIGMGTLFMVVVLVAAALAIWIPNSVKGRDEPLECRAIEEDSDRFDCHPDRPLTRESCEKRGCCYRPGSDLNVEDSELVKSRFLGVPSCFFPKDYEGYKWTYIKRQKSKSEAYFERQQPSGFAKDIQRVFISTTPIDEHRIRIQINDSSASRFEPDIPLSLDAWEETENSAYWAGIDDETGFLHVIRKSSNQNVFTADVKRLIFSERFIQLSTTVASQYVYGLGEQKETMLKSNFNWQRYTLFNQGDLPVPNRNLYGSHPFFLVMDPILGESYGIFLLNSNAMDYVLQPTPAITFRTVGGILDFFIFLGPTPGEVVSQYTSLFGKPNFPPRWSLGFHLCKYGYFSLDKTVEVLDRNLEAGIPIDVQWHDIDYMQRHLDFTYDNENFKGLPEFVDKLHKDGRHYVAMISPGLSNTEEPGKYPAYDEAKRLNIFVKMAGSEKPIQGKVWNDNYTVFPDFSHPDTADYWKKQFKEFHSKLNFDGVWLDMNEPLNFFNGSVPGDDCPGSEFDKLSYVPGRPYPLNTLTLCMSAMHNKTEHYNEHNLVAYREAKATHAAMSEITGKRPFLISRASFSGQGVYSGHWSGDITSDWDDMRYTISAMLTFSLYGMPMTGSDICGFRQNTTEELCAVWQSLGAFYPFSRNHNDYDTIEQDPVAMGENVVKSTRNALKIRYYLLPYLYTLFYRNYVYGETVARPLFFEFPNDEKTYNIEDEFLWGPALLIMPALYPDIDSISPYIPAGVWYNLEGKSYTSSGENFTFKANLTSINVLLRGGYILPAQEPGKTTTESARNPFDLLVALNNETKAMGGLFWDDGETLHTYESKKYNVIKLSADNNTLNVSPAFHGYDSEMPLRHIKVYGLSKEPKNVTINDKEVEYTFKDKLLRVTATGHSLLETLTVIWS